MSIRPAPALVTVLTAVSVAALSLLGTAAPAAAQPTASRGSTLPTSVGLVRGVRPSSSLHMTQSTNWSGYNQGTLERGGTTFHSITGEWVVPTASPHQSGQAEYSATWIGIGGGCVDSGCTVTDSTLIQTGTEQDVNANGTTSYSAWYELIPAPSVSVPLRVAPGNLISAAITETTPGVWSISLKNLSTGASWATTTPYSSDYSTAEWIEETPVVFGTNGVQVGPLPNLTPVHFDAATTNGVNAGLLSSEEMQLVGTNGAVLATPSAPDANTDGFADCSYATSCATPGDLTAAGQVLRHRQRHRRG